MAMKKKDFGDTFDDSFRMLDSLKSEIEDVVEERTVENNPNNENIKEKYLEKEATIEKETETNKNIEKEKKKKETVVTSIEFDKDIYKTMKMDTITRDEKISLKELCNKIIREYYESRNML